MEEKIKIAVEMLKEGKSFKVGEIMLGAEIPGLIEVTGWSRYLNFANLTKSICISELEEVKALFYEMIETYQELKDYIKDKPILFNLWYDDSGKVSVGICSEQDGKLTWEADLRD